MDTAARLGSLVGFIFLLVAWVSALDKAGYPRNRVILMTALMVVPLVNLGTLIYFGFAEWPIQRELKELKALRVRLGEGTEEDALAFYCEGSRLEANGETQAALAQYEQAMKARPGSTAAKDAEASIRSLRARTG